MPVDRSIDEDEYADDKDADLAAASGQRRRFREFECPDCAANNPVDDGFGNGDEGHLQLLRPRVSGDRRRRLPTPAQAELRNLVRESGWAWFVQPDPCDQSGFARSRSTLFDVLVKAFYRLEVFVRSVSIAAIVCGSALALAGPTEPQALPAVASAASVVPIASSNALDLKAKPAGDSPAGSPVVPQSAKTGDAVAKSLADPDDEDSDDDDESEDAIESASDELSAAKAAEAKALSDEEQLRTQRIVAPSALGPGNPVLR